MIFTLEAWLLTFLLNSVWQIPLVVAAAWLVARLLRPAGPLAEHRVWYSAALLGVVLPACSLPSRLSPFSQRSSSLAGSSITVHQGPAFTHAGLQIPHPLAMTILLLYTLFLLYASLRLVRGIRLTLRLRRSAHPVLLNPDQAPIWSACVTHFRLPPVSFAESETLGTPVTLGHGDPCILFPAGLLATLAPRDLHTILAHEAAHIRRRDFTGNLVLQAITLPVSFHPFLHIALARLTETREIVCDTLAAEAAPMPGGRIAYAHSLLRLASALVQGPSAAAPHAIGIFDAHTLERRITSMTQPRPHPTLLRRTSLVAVTLVLAVATCTGAVALRTPFAPADPVHVASGIMAGQVNSRVMPKYPQAAKEAKIQGAVILHAIIGKDGAIDHLTVVGGPPELQTSALDAVRQWTYQPYLLNGEPTEVDTTITVNYTLGN